MSKYCYVRNFFLLLAIAAVALGKVQTAMEKEQLAAEEATIKKDKRTGIDNLWLGRFLLERTDANFPKILEATGYSKDVIKKFVANEEMKISITKKDDTYTVWTTIAGNLRKETFQPGKEYTSTLVDGRSYKGIVTVKNDHEFDNEITIGAKKMFIEATLDEMGFAIGYTIDGIDSILRFEKDKKQF